MSDTDNTSDRTVRTNTGDRYQRDRKREAETLRENTVRVAIKRGYEDIADGDILSVWKIIVERLTPNLPVSEHNVDEYHEKVADTDLYWDFVDVSTFLRDPWGLRDDYLSERRDRIASKGDAERIIESAFKSIESIASLEGIVETDVDRRVTLYGYGGEDSVIGKWLTPWDWDTPDSIQVLDPDDELKFTLYQGATGQGKSTALETEVEDRIRAGHKIVDIIDLQQGESMLWDVPQQQETLKTIRSDMGLPETFEDDPNYDPTPVEVYVPMTRDIDTYELPYNTDRDEFVIKPFTIPASRLNRRSLTRMLSHTTTTQDSYLDEAYQTLSNSGKDWTLKDFKDRLEDEIDNQSGIVDRMTTTLKTLQERGFIRDEKCPHTINWRDIFENEDRITVFSMAFLDDDAVRYMVLAYVLESLYSRRAELKTRMSEAEWGSLRNLTLVMRELHELAPSRAEMSDDPLESDLQSATTGLLQKIGKRHRHIKIGLVADTQMFKRQLNPNVRTHVDRIVTFANQRQDVEEAFKTRVSNYREYASKVSQYDSGTCAYISATGFRMPVKAVPPSCHHYDTDTDGTGWGVRNQVLNSEDLRQPPDWDTEIPDRLKFNGDNASNDGEEDNDGPVATYADLCLAPADPDSDDEWVFKSDVRDAYDEYARERGLPSYSPAKFGRLLRDALGERDTGQRTRVVDGQKKRPRTYEDLRLSPTGEDYLNQAHGDNE